MKDRHIKTVKGEILKETYIDIPSDKLAKIKKPMVNPGVESTHEYVLVYKEKRGKKVSYTHETMNMLKYFTGQQYCNEDVENKFKDILDKFNATLRPGEVRREYVKTLTITRTAVVSDINDNYDKACDPDTKSKATIRQRGGKIIVTMQGGRGK